MCGKFYILIKPVNGQEDAGSLRVLRVKWVKWREKSVQERTGEMGVLSGLKPKRVFEIFEELTRIPRGNIILQMMPCVTYSKLQILK